MTLPNLFSTSMDSGDLDNDGDIDFIINGQDANNNWKKYIYKRKVFFHCNGFNNCQIYEKKKCLFLRLLLN